MKQAALQHRKAARFPITRGEAERAARRINAADTCDDRVSENIFDVDDERAEVDIIIHGMSRSTN